MPKFLLGGGTVQPPSSSSRTGQDPALEDFEHALALDVRPDWKKYVFHTNVHRENAPVENGHSCYLSPYPVCFVPVEVGEGCTAAI